MDECFIDCMSNLLTAVGKDVKIEVSLKEGATFHKAPGKYWKDLFASQKLVVMNALFSDQTYEFLCYINVPSLSPGPHSLISCVLTYDAKGV